MNDDNREKPHGSEAEILRMFKRFTADGMSEEIAAALIIAAMLRGIEKSLDAINESLPS